ncbi:hypothetical protein BDR06DRAFT_966808 [Suillus hirtellus]|nr:hypothetical protein BDR06DRAFT_966808 [Suillus hirtellus]
MVNNDPHIKTHPQFHKTVGYCPLPPAYPDAEPEPSMSSSTVLVEPNLMRGTLVIASKAPDLIQSLHVVPEVQPSIAELLPPAASVVEPLISGVQITATGMLNPEPTSPCSISIAPVAVVRNVNGNQRALSVKAHNAVAPTATSLSEIVDKRGFWDAESRPVGWGLDATVSMAVEHSIHYHPRKCDKCIKMDVQCIVLLEKKFGCTRLACANCNEMKITCAIDGVGIWQRLQAKVQKAVIKSSIDPEVKCSRMHAPKSCTAVKTPVLSAPLKTAKLSRCLSLALKKVVFENPPIVWRCSWSISITYLEVQHEPEAMMPDDANIRASHNIQSFRSLQLPPVDVPAPLKSSMAPTPSEPEPTARDILQSIQDLSRRFDLLATDRQVDALHVRLDSVEWRISLRLTVLEEEFSLSNAHRKNYLYAHGPHAHGTAYAPQYPPEPTITSWPKHNHASDEPLGISTIGREYTHAWALHDEALTSTSGWWQTNSLDPPYICKASIASSPLSSASPIKSEE